MAALNFGNEIAIFKEITLLDRKEPAAMWGKLNRQKLELHHHRSLTLCTTKGFQAKLMQFSRVGSTRRNSQFGAADAHLHCIIRQFHVFGGVERRSVRFFFFFGLLLKIR